ncbi:MAG: DUF3570 domain-containing protein [Gammaproteobacteria bacterium]
MKRGRAAARRRAPRVSLASAPTPALAALCAAAMALPGVAGADESGGELGLSYAHHREGRREVYGYNDGFAPLRADSLLAHGALALAPDWHARLDFQQDTWAGATPVTTLPLAVMTPLSDVQLLSGASAKPSTGRVDAALVDAALRPYVNVDANPFTPRYDRDERVIHMLTAASAETRKEGRGALDHEWANGSVGLGGGVSDEPDYRARFVDLHARFDFEQKRSTVTVGVNRAWSRTAVTLPDYWLGWVDSSIGEARGEIRVNGEYPNGSPRLEVRRARHDWGLDLGFSRVMTRGTLLEFGLAWRLAEGYLDNSYRVTSFLTRDAAPTRLAVDGTPLYGATLFHTYEQRPGRRAQWQSRLGLVQDLRALDAALHASYGYYRDDWSITAHTLEVEWRQALGAAWTLAPRLRYYGQSQANFYTPFVLCGTEPGLACALARRRYSSDYRLAAFGALTPGLGLTWRIARGITLDLGGEYYLRRENLAPRAGVGDYADFDHFLLSAGLQLAFDAAPLDTQHASHAHHAAHGASHRAPAGVADAHVLDQAGQWMLGYRYQFTSQSGGMRHGRSGAGDAAIIAAAGCDPPGCNVRPRTMRMHMHMLDLMVAVTPRLSVMLMPQFMDMNMRLAPLAGSTPGIHASHDGHQTGGVGDLQVGARYTLYARGARRLVANLGLSVPTGDATLRLNPVAGHDHNADLVRRPDYLHYGMQLGSGTWDLLPGLVYTDGAATLSWGARLAAVSRTGQRNDAGYALGERLETSAWVGIDPLPQVTFSLRGLMTLQGKIRGRFDGHAESDLASGFGILVPNAIAGPMDNRDSYGGRFYDLGVGVSATLPRGWFGAGRVACEWLEPVSHAVNGYQLARDGSLTVSFSAMF